MEQDELGTSDAGRVEVDGGEDLGSDERGVESERWECVSESPLCRWRTLKMWSRVVAVINGRWAVSDLRQINGGRALRYGETFGEEFRGREVFRCVPFSSTSSGSRGADRRPISWNLTNPRQFAVLSSDPKASPAVKIFSTAFPPGQLLPSSIYRD